MRIVTFTGAPLSVEDVVDVPLGLAQAELGEDVPARMQASLDVVTSAIHGSHAVYGVNTGFGKRAKWRRANRAHASRSSTDHHDG